MSDVDQRQKAIDDNFEAFRRQLPDLLKTHAGKFALLREGGIVEYFDTARDAMIYGSKEYADGLFSIQEVTDRSANLGYFSHALHLDPV